ncbi:MAG TPA: hypothetical protein VGS58_19250 [Candidatus Sulfopaludibacter sp.]|nr:hypothetical protein [Candidatus Sulfopaludibacter sp.]
MKSSSSLERLLDRLEACKRQFGTPEQRALPRLLETLGRRRFPDAHSLIRFHEALLFFRAYPANARVVRLTEQLLDSLAARVDRLRRSGGDLTPFEEPDVSGIAATEFSAIFSYDIARWLAERHAREVDIDWDATDPALLGPLLSGLNPMFAEDALVEANIPFREWFGAMKPGRGSDLRWLAAATQRLRLAPALFDHARLAIRWELGDSPATRTRLRLARPGRFFYHHQALLRRSDVSLAAELASPPLPLEKLSRAQGEKILNLFRSTSAMRYRELHGFTYGDAAHLLRADLGRGVEFYVCGVPADHRLPLRAYHAGMYFKNAVPIGYIECLTFFERIEVGFNLYYTFREGETAWLYARLLRVFRQMLGVSSFAVDPYQLGLHNEEAIESGAFWFYRKLGFRPANARVTKLLETEEAKLRADPGYRTPAAILRRLSAGWMLYEMPGTRPGDWDNFEIRRVAMAVTRPPFPVRIERAKRAPLESSYVRLLQQDQQLRKAIIRLGSRQS